jgi:hypothetical protein
MITSNIDHEPSYWRCISEYRSIVSPSRRVGRKPIHCGLKCQWAEKIDPLLYFLKIACIIIVHYCCLFRNILQAAYSICIVWHIIAKYDIQWSVINNGVVSVRRAKCFMCGSCQLLTLGLYNLSIVEEIWVGELVEWYWQGETKVLREESVPVHFAHHKLHMDRSPM